MIIDFKEIPSSRGGNSGQDAFELFAREFLVAIGFEILEGPDRGADGGRDIIALEKRSGIVGVTEFRWLVSCKHYAHSGKAVGADDEVNIRDRMKRFSCNGFLGFYSTLPSSGLSDRLTGIEKMILDHERIEGMLLEDGKAYSLIERFFPESWKKIKPKETEPSNLLKKYFPLRCDCCGRDLLQNPDDGIIALCEITEGESIKVIDAYCACRGDCDEKIEDYYFKKSGAVTSWHDLNALVIPRYYLGELLGIPDKMQDGFLSFSDEAYQKVRDIYIRISQMVMRKHTKEEEERMTILDMAP